MENGAVEAHWMFLTKYMTKCVLGGMLTNDPFYLTDRRHTTNSCGRVVAEFMPSDSKALLRW